MFLNNSDDSDMDTKMDFESNSSKDATLRQDSKTQHRGHPVDAETQGELNTEAEHEQRTPTDTVTMVTQTDPKTDREPEPLEVPEALEDQGLQIHVDMGKGVELQNTTGNSLSET